MKVRRNEILQNWLCIMLMLITSGHVFSQSSTVTIPTVTAFEASNPAYIRSYVKTSAESYDFFENATFYALQLGYFYGIGTRHLAGLTIPFYHNIFAGDYGGYENTTGIGDIRMSYMFNALEKKVGGPGLQRISPYIELSAPTGEYKLGRGAGAWLYKPGVIFSFSPIPEVSFYPEIKYQFSIGDVNSQGGSDGLPDPEDPVKEGKYQNLIMVLPCVIVLKDWDGWFSLNAQYEHSFTEKVDFIFLRTDIGKMFGDYTAGSLNISKFIAGQPRLNIVIQAKFNIYLGR
jgi:hypothetical protein